MNLKAMKIGQIQTVTAAFSLDIDSWKGWRAEEKEDAKRVMESIMKASPAKLKESYFLRDVAVSFLEKHPHPSEKDVEFLAGRLKDLLKKDVTKIVSDALKLWEGDNSVQAYRTPKSILYTIRGDRAN
jgi:hypothetical protein